MPCGGCRSDCGWPSEINQQCSLHAAFVTKRQQETRERRKEISPLQRDSEERGDHVVQVKAMAQFLVPRPIPRPPETPTRRRRSVVSPPSSSPRRCSSTTTPQLNPRRFRTHGLGGSCCRRLELQ